MFITSLILLLQRKARNVAAGFKLHNGILSCFSFDRLIHKHNYLHILLERRNIWLWCLSSKFKVYQSFYRRFRVKGEGQIKQKLYSC